MDSPQTFVDPRMRERSKSEMADRAFWLMLDPPTMMRARLQTPLEATNGIRTRDLTLTKGVLYH